MPEPTTYEIVIQGRPSARLLRPMLDDFAFHRTPDGRTHLVGDVIDAAHLSGLVAHLASVRVDVISIAPLGALIEPLPTNEPRSTNP